MNVVTTFYFGRSFLSVGSVKGKKLAEYEEVPTQQAHACVAPRVGQGGKTKQHQKGPSTESQYKEAYYLPFLCCCAVLVKSCHLSSLVKSKWQLLALTAVI